MRSKVSSWAPLPENEFASTYRHDWVFERNNLPRDPVFLGCPMPRRGSDEIGKNAALILTYLRPFILNPSTAVGDVPFLGDHLCAEPLRVTVLESGFRPSPFKSLL